MPVRAAALQFFATPFDLGRNLETAERLARAAAAQGARLIVLPELFNTGYVYTPRLPQAAEPPDGPTTRWLSRLSAQLGAHLAGSLLLRESGAVFNTLTLASPDGALFRYRKQNPFLWERLYFDAGRAPLIADTALGRLGLMVCWDIARRDVWEAYRGRVDALLIASAPPRLHRAVLNFPLGRKLYLAQLLPALVRERGAIDAWYGEALAARAAWLGAPIVHAVMAGRFVSDLPLARLSLLAAALTQPRYWPWARRAPLASMRATFYASSAIYGAGGETLAAAAGDEAVALADLDIGARRDLQPVEFPPWRIPGQLQLMEALMRPAARVLRRRGPPAPATEAP